MKTGIALRNAYKPIVAAAFFVLLAIPMSQTAHSAVYYHNTYNFHPHHGTGIYYHGTTVYPHARTGYHNGTTVYHNNNVYHHGGTYYRGHWR